MDDIAKENGISKRTLYEILPSKEDIIREIVNLHIASEKKLFSEITKKGVNSIEMMIELSRLIFHMYSKINPKVLFDLKKYYRDIWNVIEKFNTDAVREIIEFNIDKGIKEKLYRSEIDPVIVSLLFVKQLQLFSDETNIHFGEKASQEIINQFFEYNLYGIMSPAGVEYYKNLKK